MRARPSRLNPLLLAALLLLITASRAFRLDATVTEVTVDEVWSVWQTFGTPAQILNWTPYDWTPGYYLTLGAWRGLVGIQPAALRWLSALAFVIGAAIFYRAARRLGGSGVIAMLAYAAFGFLIFLSTELRGYALLLALYPLAIWLTLRYFDHPHFGRAILLALTLAAMLYISLTSAAATAALALFALIVYGRAIWHGWLPAALTLLIALPILIAKAGIAVTRTSGTASIVLKPLPEALAEIARQWSGSAPLVWLALFGIALALAFAARQRRRALALLIWSLLPLALYTSNPLLGFFNVRYAWWVMPGIALLIGLGLARLPRAGQWTAAAIFGGLALLPIPLDQYQIPQPPLGTAFAWLRDHAQPGDTLLIDPRCACGAPEVFDYYTRVYFPDGLRAITDAADARRIWYVTGASGATPSVRAAVEAGRRASIFVGPPESLFRLYEAPPDRAGVPFENGMRFHGIDLLDVLSIPVYHEGDTVNLRLWWSADQPPALDYSVGLYVIDAAGRIIAQDDRAPNVADAPAATSQWQPDALYVESRTLTLPYPLARGQYRLMMAVYWFGDAARIDAPGVNADGLLPLLDFTVVSWGH